jgi:hypothetical protein
MSLTQSILPLWTAFEGIAGVAAPAAVSALWQSALVACGMALGLGLVPRVRASHRFVIWASAFAILVGLPFLPLLHPAGPVGTAAPSAPATAWLELDGRWSLVLAGLWGALSLARAAGLTAQAMRLARLWRSAVPADLLTDPLPRGARVCTSTEIDRPSVIGFFSPRILIPEWLFGRLTAGELSQIVLHESEHLRRGDDWTNLVQRLCLVLFPLNPALWWIDRQLARSREMACDEGVIRITHAPRAYAACLASLAERGIEHRAEALSLGAWHRRPELVHRVHSILDRNRQLHPVASAGLFAALGCGLITASVAFAHCPELIGFAPADHWQVERARGLDPGDARLPRPKAGSGPAYHAVPVRALVPAPGRSLRHTPRTVAKSSAPHFASMQEAKLTALESSSRPEQRWVVFTAWEQVETTSAPAPGAGPETARADAAAVPQGQGYAETGRVTRTLILRVLPTGSRSTPGAISIANGWLVIQL